jgi:hypothetical protein
MWAVLLTSAFFLKGFLLLATLCEGLKGTALVISKLKQKPLETTAASESSGPGEEVTTLSSDLTQ